MASNTSSNALTVWLSRYGQSHQNLTNKRLHCLCVPVITWSVLALLWQLPLSQLPLLPINGAIITGCISLAFYWSLSPRLTWGMGVLILGIFLSFSAHQYWLPWPLTPSASLLFIGAWIGQFIGHHIEGAKPSFF
ncbi:MAG: Mpo1-like protein [Ferrimonas sp.]